MRLIDADALLRRLKKDPLFPLVEQYGMSGVIDAEPTVDAEPIKHGRWWRVPLEIANSTHHYVFMTYRCSECKHAFDQKTPYCPWCGAKMEKRKKE